MAIWERFYGSALVVVVAVDQVLRFEKRLRKLTGDAELARARREFRAAVDCSPSAIRDVAMHLDEYAVGEGNRQIGRGRSGEAAIKTRNVKASTFWTNRGESYLDLGGHRLSVDRTAQAAIELAEVVERVREKHQRQAVGRLNAAILRQAGLDA